MGIGFCQMLFLHILKESSDFAVLSIDVLKKDIIVSPMLSQTCITDKSYLVMVCNTFMPFWTQFANVLLRIFSCKFLRATGLQFSYNVSVRFWCYSNTGLIE